MKNINQTELKRIQLDILDDIHCFCEKNNITYYLFAGTLIGAVRHKGYIPWDDDIDICMKREDYNMFFDLYNKREDSIYRAINADNYKGYYLAAGKVIDTRTTMIEAVNSKCNIGVYVDIFPMDYAPDGVEFERLDKKLNRFRKALFFKNLTERKGRGIVKNGVVALLHFFLAPIDVSIILNRIKELSTSYYDKKEECSMLGDISVFTYGKNELFFKSKFDEIVKLEFEGKLYNAPGGYAEILSQMYGDYMKLPPKDKQVSHHVFKAYWSQENN